MENNLIQKVLVSSPGSFLFVVVASSSLHSGEPHKNGFVIAPVVNGEKHPMQRQ